jgi:hypothetical protein
LWKGLAFGGVVCFLAYLFAGFERKNDIHAKVAIASVMGARYQDGMDSCPFLAVCET